MSSARFSSRITRPESALPVLCLLAILQVFVRYVRVTLGGQPLFYDALHVWRRVARQTLEGATLYVDVADNKPPLFEYLNIAVGATGHYVLAFHVLIGIANVVSVVLLYRWVSQHFDYDLGALAAFFFVATLPMIQGTIINVRSFALVGILVALLATTPFRRGVALATAGMFSQYVVFAVPVLVYDAYRSEADLWPWVARFGVGCGAVVTITYGSVAAFWGTDAFIAAVEMSVFRSGHFVTEWTSNTPWRDPLGWAGSMLRSSMRILFVLVPAGLGALSVQRLGATRAQDRMLWLSVGLAGAYLLQFAVKASNYYWMLVVPFAATLAAVVILRGLGDRGEVAEARNGHR